jgi:hypothetical protein
MDDIKLGNSNILDIVSKLNSLNANSRYLYYSKDDDNWELVNIPQEDGSVNTLWGLAFDENRFVKSMFNIDGVELYSDTYYDYSNSKIYLCVNEPIDCIVYELVSGMQTKSINKNYYLHDITITISYPECETYKSYSQEWISNWPKDTLTKDHYLFGKKDEIDVDVDVGVKVHLRFTIYNTRASNYSVISDFINENGNMWQYPNNINGFAVSTHYHRWRKGEGASVNGVRQIYMFDLYSGIYLRLYTFLSGETGIDGYQYATSAKGGFRDIPMLSPGLYTYELNLDKATYITIEDNVLHIGEK